MLHFLKDKQSEEKIGSTTLFGACGPHLYGRLQEHQNVLIYSFTDIQNPKENETKN